MTTDRSAPADSPLKGLIEAKAAAGKGLPPVHLWEPVFCGDLDMRIAADGTWFYMKTPIGRKPLVRLFSSVLRHDEDGRYYLVTPVEKVGITVDDAPFLAVEMEVEGKGGKGKSAKDQVIRFRTNVDDVVEVAEATPLRFEIESGTDGLKPYVLVRARLEALVSRAVFYDLVNLGEVETVEGVETFGVWSHGTFFAMMPADQLKV